MRSSVRMASKSTCHTSFEASVDPGHTTPMNRRLGSHFPPSPRPSLTLLCPQIPPFPKLRLTMSSLSLSEKRSHADLLLGSDVLAGLDPVASSSHGVGGEAFLRRSSRASSHDSRESTSSKYARTSALSITPTAAWNNDTFEAEVCVMDATTTSVIVSLVATLPLPFLVPDCFYNYGSVTYASMGNVIFQGNATFPDPLDRLATAMKTSTTTGILFYNCHFQTYGTSSATYTVPDWTQFFATYPAIISLTMQNCSLSGSLPARLPKTVVILYLNQNSLTGSIPATLFENYASKVVSSVVLYSFASNQLSGTIPSGLLAPIPASASIYLYLNNNNLTGTIPSDLFAFTKASTITGIVANFGSNSFTDSLPSDLWGFPATTTNSLTRLYLYFSVNTGLTGTIPSKWLSQYSFPALTIINLVMNNCRLSGNIHSGLIPASAPLLTGYSLTLSGNPMNGSITSGLLPAVLTLPRNTGVLSTFTFTLFSSGLTGALVLPSPPSTLTNFPSIVLYLSSNSLTAFSAEVNTSKYLSYLDVSSNTALRGYVDNLFSTTSSLMTYLNLGNTLISGTMPDMSQMNTSALASMTMTSTRIEFCGNPNATAWAPTALTSCVLSNTTAYYCSSLYPAVCSLSDPTPFSPAPPFALPPIDAEPIDPPVPVASAPVPTPIAPTCSNATKPGDQFYCNNGVWTSNTTVTTPVLNIPSGASETIIIGDLESSSIVFNGLGSTLTIEGCASNLTSITLTLTPDDLKGSKQIVQQLIILANSNCSNDDLTDIVVSFSVSGSTCRKVKPSKSVSNGSLSGIFTIDSSSCNTWWIVLVSVICGVIVLGIVIFVLLVIFVPKVRFAVRPHSRPRQGDTL